MRISSVTGENPSGTDRRQQMKSGDSACGMTRCWVDCHPDELIRERVRKRGGSNTEPSVRSTLSISAIMDRRSALLILAAFVACSCPFAGKFKNQQIYAH